MNQEFTPIQKSNCSGRVIWITGLSGAGKSTLAKQLTIQMKKSGDNVILLDGDDLRTVLDTAGISSKNHNRETRLVLAMRYAYLCKMLSSQGSTVIISTISLFREVHKWNRENLPNYFEAYLRVPLEELRRRDPKGIYRRFDAGELTDVAGLDLPIDEPEAPNWVADFDPGQTIKMMVNNLLSNLEKKE